MQSIDFLIKFYFIGYQIHCSDSETCSYWLIDLIQFSTYLLKFNDLVLGL